MSSNLAAERPMSTLAIMDDGLQLLGIEWSNSSFFWDGWELQVCLWGYRPRGMES